MAKNIEQLTTSFKESRRVNHTSDLNWDDRLFERVDVSSVSKKPENPSTHALVSIRCRRHKRRFNVPVIWLDTCAWLCPKCYNKLTPSERKKYAPIANENPEVREANSHDKTVSIIVDKSGNKTPLPLESKTEKCQCGNKKTQSRDPQDDSLGKKIAEVAKLHMDETMPKVGKGEIEMACIYCNTTAIVPKSYYYSEHFFCPHCARRLNEGEKRRFKKAFMSNFWNRYIALEDKFNKMVKAEASKEAQRNTTLKNQSLPTK